MLPNIRNWKRRRKRLTLRYSLGAMACGLAMGLGLGILFQVDLDPANKLVILLWTFLIDVIFMVMMYEDFIEVMRLDRNISIETRKQESLVDD